MTTTRLVATATATAALLTLSLAGCSLASGLANSAAGPTSSATTAASRPTSSATKSADPTPSPAASDPGSSSAITDVPDHCPSPQSILSDLGLSVGYPAVTPADTTLDCLYAPASSAGISINFSTEESVTPDQAEAKLKAMGTTPAFQSVPGVGDAAFFDNASGGSYIVVLSGKLTFHVVVSTPVSVSALTTFARDILNDND